MCEKAKSPELVLKQIQTAPEGLYTVYQDTLKTEDGDLPCVTRCPALLLGLYEDPDTGEQVVSPIDERSLRTLGTVLPMQFKNFVRLDEDGTELLVAKEKDLSTLPFKVLSLICIVMLALVGWSQGGIGLATKMLLCGALGAVMGRADEA